MLEIQFGVSESAANYIFDRWINILRDLLPAALLEQVKKTQVKGSGFKKSCPGLS